MLWKIKLVGSLNLKEYILCIFSAALLILSFPNSNLWVFAWFGFVPLFFALQNKSKGKAFLLSYLTGVIFWLGIIYWLIHVTLLGMVFLVLYLALYFGIFGLIISAIGHRSSVIDLLFIPSSWVLLEYIRSYLFTGFPWALLGYSQYLNLPVIQLADITGAWGVSFLVMLGNTILYSVTRHTSHVTRPSKKRELLLILCMLVVLIYGFYKLYVQRATCNVQRIKVSVIQGNISQELKWNANSRDFIMDKYSALTCEALKDRPDLVIWPEASLPVVLEEVPVFFERIKEFVKENKVPLLLGAVTRQNKFYYNSALLVSGKGELLNRYDKLHLVPFGEYIPLRKMLGFLETVVPIGDIASGREYTIFKSPVTSHQSQVNFSVLICFEDLFPGLSRQFVKKGADFLVNITNDAWFGETSAPYQHLQASVFRAVENRLNLVRSANTGISAFINPSGKITALVQEEKGRDIFVRGYQTQEIIVARRNPSFYTRCGDIFAAGCGLFALLYLIFTFKKKR